MHHVIALDKLKQGNRRFVAGTSTMQNLATPGRRVELAKDGQSPFAIVLSCADSRVPAEMVFDCGLGELFVLRVAGNVVAPSLIGSIEFAAENFATELCVVMGHSGCGAVAATFRSVMSGNRPHSDNVNNIVREIAPSVREAMRLENASEAVIVADATRRNVIHSVEALSARSPTITSLVSQGKLRIVGATYDLFSGAVHFIEDYATSTNPRHALSAPRADRAHH